MSNVLQPTKGKEGAMRKKKILWMAAVALLALPLGAFTKMDITRVLLMNDDTNETWAVLGQGYINTNTFDSTYWIHEGGII